MKAGAEKEFLENLLREADALHGFDHLLSALRDTVIPNLRRFPRMGRRYLDQPPPRIGPKRSLNCAGCPQVRPMRCVFLATVIT